MLGKDEGEHTTSASRTWGHRHHQLATTHSEEGVEIREAKALVARRDGVEGSGVIEDMVVEGELATGQRKTDKLYRSSSLEV